MDEQSKRNVVELIHSLMTSNHHVHAQLLEIMNGSTYLLMEEFDSKESRASGFRMSPNFNQSSRVHLLRSFLKDLLIVDILPMIKVTNDDQRPL
jgi:hypothetical protein